MFYVKADLFPFAQKLDSGQRLVHRMPVNPRKMVFVSTQEIFEVPLRPEERLHNSSHCKLNEPNEGLSDLMNDPANHGSSKPKNNFFLFPCLFDLFDI